MTLVNFVAFVVLKILDNLVCMQNSLMQITADVSKILKIAQRDLAFTINVLSESSIHFV